MEKNKLSLTIRILYYWGKFVGLNPPNLSDNNKVKFSYFGVLYGLFLGTTYTYIFYRVFDNRLKSSMAGETPVAVIVFCIWISCRFLDTVLTWLISALYQNRIKFIITSFVEAEKTAKKLGISQNYEKVFCQLGTHVVITNILYMVALGFTLADLSRFSNFHTRLWIFYDIPQIATVNMEILFIWSLNVVEEKFHCVNEKLRFLITSNHRNVNEVTKKRRPRLPSDSSYSISESIAMLSKLHRQLRDIVCLIGRHFAILVLFSLTGHFMHITLDVYLFYRSVKVYRSIDGVDFKYIIPLGCWLLASVVVLIIVSNVCDSTSKKANATGNILHAMLNDCKKCPMFEETAKFHMLSLDLLNNRLTISIFGFFELNDFFVYSTLTAATTYLVIMLQLYS